MRYLLLVPLLLSLVAPGFGMPPPRMGAASCEFTLGFKALHDRTPDMVGECLEDVRHDPLSGDGFQRTIGGLLFWRKYDNHTAFTDGYRTWVNGPYGAQQRLNTERFPWESVQQLRNTEYHLPEQRPIRLVNGEYTYYSESPPERIHAGLLGDVVAVGNLNSDEVADAAATLFLNTGGSGTFIYLIALVDRDGVLAQAGRGFLGDRVKVNSVIILDDGMITVDMIAHGPNEPLCCPTQKRTQIFRLQGDELKEVE